jgi:hypothetical protein
MAKLLLADSLKFGLRLFELGILLAKVGFSPVRGLPENFCLIFIGQTP